MIASLMMYSRPELDGAHDRYWQWIRKFLAAAGIPAPEKLSLDMGDGDEISHWLNPHLVLAQSCGLPYRTRLKDKVTLIGTPDFGVEGCPPGYYRSAIIVRKGDQRHDLTDFRKAVFACNQTGSQSGYAAFREHLKPMGFWFENRMCLGQHVFSAKAVAHGQADIAAIDAVSWRLMKKYDGFTQNLRVLDWTVPTPGLPYITALGMDREQMFNAVQKAISHLGRGDRELLGLRGITYIPPEIYFAVPGPEIE